MVYLIFKNMIYYLIYYTNFYDILISHFLFIEIYNLLNLISLMIRLIAQYIEYQIYNKPIDFQKIIMLLF